MSLDGARYACPASVAGCASSNAPPAVARRASRPTVTAKFAPGAFLRPSTRRYRTARFKLETHLASSIMCCMRCGRAPCRGRNSREVDACAMWQPCHWRAPGTHCHPWQLRFVHELELDHEHGTHSYVQIRLDAARQGGNGNLDLTAVYWRSGGPVGGLRWTLRR
jgi:hypothetical protein